MGEMFPHVSVGLLTCNFSEVPVTANPLLRSWTGPYKANDRTRDSRVRRFSCALRGPYGIQAGTTCQIVWSMPTFQPVKKLTAAAFHVISAFI